MLRADVKSERKGYAVHSLVMSKGHSSIKRIMSNIRPRFNAESERGRARSAASIAVRPLVMPYWLQSHYLDLAHRHAKPPVPAGI